ncbi:MAG: urea carboxylase-associated family protein [Rhizobacter sp.]
MEAERSEGIRRISPQSGVSFKIRRSEVLRVYDPMGEQVADLFAFKEGDLSCSLSSGRSIDYASKIFMSTGDVLYSNDSRRMFTIVADTVGRHDFLLTPCSQEMFEILYGCKGHHPSCLENLCHAFEGHGVKPHQISTTFNIFMNVTVDQSGIVKVQAPTSKAGDYIELRADMDMVCALTACSAEMSNNGSFKPIDYEIVRVPCN